MNNKAKIALGAGGGFIAVILITLLVITFMTRSDSGDSPVTPDSPVMPEISSTEDNQPTPTTGESEAPETTSSSAPTSEAASDPIPPSFGLNDDTKRRYAAMNDEERETAFIEMTADRTNEEENYLLNLRDDVCSNLASGNSPGDVATGLQDHTGWTNEDTGYFIGASVLTACPERSS